MIEKTSGNKSYFNRDSNNSRLYTNSDISVLKRIVALKVRPEFSLEKAIKQSLSENDVSDVLGADIRFDSDTPNDMQPIQDDKIKQYEALINQLIESNLKLSAQLEVAIVKLENHDKKLLELEQTSPEKLSIFNRIFKKK